MEGVKKQIKRGVEVIDLGKWLPNQNDIALLDLSPFLFKGLVLKEKDFRADLKAHDWNQYKNKPVRLFCQTNAIVPTWAFMLASTYLSKVTKVVIYADEKCFDSMYLEQFIHQYNFTAHTDQRVIIKGCSDRIIDNNIYTLLTTKLQSFAKSIMFGEPCSTVPVFKR